VNGQFVVQEGSIVKNVLPGQPVYSGYRQR